MKESPPNNRPNYVFKARRRALRQHDTTVPTVEEKQMFPCGDLKTLCVIAQNVGQNIYGKNGIAWQRQRSIGTISHGGVHLQEPVFASS